MFRCILESEITLIVKVSLKNSIIEWKKKVCKVHSAQHIFFGDTSHHGLTTKSTTQRLPTKQCSSRPWSSYFPCPGDGLDALQSIGFSAIADQAKVSDTVLLESKWRSMKREIQTSPQTIIVNKIQKIDPTLAPFNCKCSKVSEEKCFFALKAGLCHKKTLSKMRARFITRHHVSKQSKPCNPSVLYNPKKQT